MVAEMTNFYFTIHAHAGEMGKGIKMVDYYKHNLLTLLTYGGYAVILEPRIHIYMHFNSHSINCMQLLNQMPGADPSLFG